MGEPLPYHKQSQLLTPTENAFYKTLREAVGSRWLINPKVRLADLVGVEQGARQWYTHFNKVAQKHVDFALCDPDTSAPVLVVELDDDSHRQPNRIMRDKFVDAALASAGLPILHVVPQPNYEPDELLGMIESRIYRYATHLPNVREDEYHQYEAPVTDLSTPHSPSTWEPSTGIRSSRPARHSTSRRKQSVSAELFGIVLTLASIAVFLGVISNPSIWMPRLTALSPTPAPTKQVDTGVIAPGQVTPPAPDGSAGGDVTSDVYAVVITTSLNMRAGPGTEYAIIGVYNEGTRLKVSGKAFKESEVEHERIWWLRVTTPDGRVGWMSGREGVTQANVPLDQLPVVPTLPTPARAP